MTNSYDKSSATMRFMGALIVSVIVLSIGSAVPAATPISVGTAGADLMLADGIDAITGNPALLSVTATERWQIRVVGVGGGFRSNGLGFADYKRYNGAKLTDSDKNDILNAINPDGFLLRAEGSATALAIRRGSWAFTSSIVGSAQGRLDRDAIELLLFGNAHKSEWTFDNTDGAAYGAWRAGLSHGRTIATLNNRPVYAGLTVSYLRGLYYAEASDITGNVATLSSGLSGQGFAETLTASGGSGIGIDLGFSWQAGAQTTFGLKLENLVHSIRWNDNVESRSYELQFDELTIDNFDDSLWTSDETSVAGASFSRGLPLQLRLGIGQNLARARLAAEAVISLSDRLIGTSAPRLATGIEYPLASSLLLRSGVAFGGDTGFAIGWGMGLRLGALAIDAAVQVDRGAWIGYGSGLTGALTLDIRI